MNGMDEILEYVMHTPINSNPNVLKGLLEKFQSESSGAAEGWKLIPIHFDLDSGTPGTDLMQGYTKYDCTTTQDELWDMIGTDTQCVFLLIGTSETSDDVFIETCNIQGDIRATDRVITLVTTKMYSSIPDSNQMELLGVIVMINDSEATVYIRQTIVQEVENDG